MVVRAFPPTQTRHGNYTEYTNACTACHGLHSSKTQRLLKGPTITDLCGTCHDGTGSKYDEVRGRVRTGPSWTSSAFAAAGPFGDALKAGSGVVTTSVHNVARACDPANEWSYDDNLTDKTGCSDGSNAPADKIWMAPGSGFLLETNSAPTNNSGNQTYRIVTNNWGSWLSCSSCHEPHDRGKNFRLFRPVINDRTNIVVRGVTMVDKDFNETTTDRGVWGGGRVGSPVFARAMYTRWLSGGNSVMTFYFAKVEDPAVASGEDMMTYYPTPLPSDPLDPPGNGMNGSDDGIEEACWEEDGTLFSDGTAPSGYRCVTSTELGGATTFCTACHRTFMWSEAWMRRDSYADPRGGSGTYSGMDKTTIDLGDFVATDGASLTNSLGQHKHPISMEVEHAYMERRLVDGVLNSQGEACSGEDMMDGDPRCQGVGQGRLVEPIVPLEGLESGKLDMANEKGYATNKIVCVTCHVSHGSGSERNEVAYKNYDLNETTDAQRDSITGYLWGRKNIAGDPAEYTTRSFGESNTSLTPTPRFGSGVDQNNNGNPNDDLFLPNDTPYWTQYGFSSELARFNPFASVCYRCHSTTYDASVTGMGGGGGMGGGM